MLVEIWSDVVCPWCYVGKRRFEGALARFPHRDEVEVRWRSFELEPRSPRERPGRPVEHLAAKYGIAVAEAQAMVDRVTAVGAGEGLSLRYDRARRGNTFDAHRLLHLAAESGHQGALKERLLRAYFTEGEPIGDPATLERLAVEVGLPGGEVADVLASDRFAEAVRADERQAQAFGAQSVPFFVFDRAYGVSGAQDAEVFAAALQQAWTEGGRPVRVGSSEAGDGCEDGACAVPESG